MRDGQAVQWERRLILITFPYNKRDCLINRLPDWIGLAISSALSPCANSNQILHQFMALRTSANCVCVRCFTSGEFCVQKPQMQTVLGMKD